LFFKSCQELLVRIGDEINELRHKRSASRAAQISHPVWNPGATSDGFRKCQHGFDSLSICSSPSHRRQHLADELVFARSHCPKGLIPLQINLASEKPVDGPSGIGDLGDSLENQCVGDLSRLPLGHRVLGVFSSRLAELCLGHADGKSYLFDIITDFLVGKLSQRHGLPS